jgi:hypothetical protein
MSAAAFPLTDDVVTFGDQVRSAPETSPETLCENPS